MKSILTIRIKNYVLLLLIGASLLSSAWAKRFTSQYCEFQLPPGWDCVLEGTEWVCQSESKDRKREAIIILAAKIRGQEDSLPQYQTYLKDRKTFSLPGGKTQVSEPKYTKLSEINGHRWVDALHLASEVPGFYTRYLATVKEDLGVAVTFSVAKDYYAQYQPVFDRIIESMRVFRQKNVALNSYKLKDKDTDLISDTTFIPDDQNKFDISAQKKKQGDSEDSGGGSLPYIIIGAIAVAAVIKMRKK